MEQTFFFCFSFYCLKSQLTLKSWWQLCIRIIYVLNILRFIKYVDKKKLTLLLIRGKKDWKYWQNGSHWKKMQKEYSGINERVNKFISRVRIFRKRNTRKQRRPQIQSSVWTDFSANIKSRIKYQWHKSREDKNIFF